MYTDTKNLANLCANSTNASAKISNQQQEDKFKLKKVWKPILRLMSRKSSNTSKANNGRSIPNNVNLNNATSASTNNTPKDLLFPAGEDVVSEECLHPTHKLPSFDLSRLQVETVTEPEATQKELEFISRVSVDKTPLNTCNICVHGRNCQHSQYHHQNANISNSSPTTTHQLHHIDFNILQAEDGCFVWSDSSGDIDEQLLRQWYWQNSWQFAENATMC